MTPNLTEIQEKIDGLKKEKTSKKAVWGNGYAVAMVILTDLLSCIFVGLGLGLLFHKIFHTSSLWIAAFTVLGGIAGLWTVSRFALNQGKRGNE